MLRKGLGRRGPPTQPCFFCQTVSHIVTSSNSLATSLISSGAGGNNDSIRISVGSRDAWLCSACECWNGERALGDPAYQNGSASSSIEGLSKSAVPMESISPAAGLIAKSKTTAARTSPFCRTCERNQALIINLLANYLPEDGSQNAAFESSLMDSLPDYRQELERRYPPLCEACADIATERVQDADRDARRRMMAEWLGRHGPSKAVREQSKADGTDSAARESLLTTRIWRLRGALWTTAQLSAITFAISRLTDVNLPLTRISLALEQNHSNLLAFHFLSLFWTCWDPTWRSRQKRHHVPNTWLWKSWITLQLLGYFLRLMQVAAAFPVVDERLQAIGDFVIVFMGALRAKQSAPESTAFLGPTPIASPQPSLPRLLTADRAILEHVPRTITFLSAGFAGLQLILAACLYISSQHSRKPQIQLRLASRKIFPSSTGTSASPERRPIAQELALADSGGMPTTLGFQEWSDRKHAMPAFGESSLPGAIIPSVTGAPISRKMWASYPSIDSGQATVEEEMDWETEGSAANDEGMEKKSYIAPQRFFPPSSEAPTGLEDLFGSALALRSDSSMAADKIGDSQAQWVSAFRLAQVVLLSLIACCTVVVVAWLAQQTLLMQ